MAILAADRPILWLGSSLADLREFPDDVKSVMGYALRFAQQGGKHPDATPLKGYQGAGVLEIIDDFMGNTYRGVYTIRFSGVVYVLHAFEKKSKQGIKTPASEMRKVNTRLRQAEAHYLEWTRQQAKGVQP